MPAYHKTHTKMYQQFKYNKKRTLSDIIEFSLIRLFAIFIFNYNNDSSQFILGNMEIFAFFIISPHWEGAGSSNSRRKRHTSIYNNPDSKIHRANVGPIWGRQDPFGPHVGVVKSHSIYRHVIDLIDHSEVFRFRMVNKIFIMNKNIERHTVHTIISWPNPKQWKMGYTSDLMMIIQ